MRERREIDGELDDDVSIVRPEANALEAITRSEVSMQIEAAHRWPRSVTKFLNRAKELACYTEEIAEGCIYSVPRDGKMIEGKSIRLAEICASSWGNLHIGARVLDEDNDQSPIITGQSVVWDLERNVKITIEAQRGVLKSSGKRYGADMVRTTGLAAVSIAFRNAVFRVIPSAYCNEIYREARATAVGDATTISARREKWMAWLAKAGVTPERVFARLGIAGAVDITLDHIATLIGLANGIKSGDLAVDVAFPAIIIPPATDPLAPVSSPAAPAAAPEGRRVQVGTGKRGKAAAPPAPPPTTPAPPPAAPASSTPAPASSSPAAPAAPPAPIDLLELLSALESVDVAWRESGDMTVIEKWSEEQRRAALTWADAVLNNRGPMATQLARPPFTTIASREPGED
jgi:hypothetical protein